MIQTNEFESIQLGLKVDFPSKMGFPLQFLPNSQHFIMGKAIFITGAERKVQLFYCLKLIL